MDRIKVLFAFLAFSMSEAFAEPNNDMYLVERGDTLSQIAQRFDMSTSELAKLNNISKNEMIRAGQKLRVSKKPSKRIKKRLSQKRSSVKTVSKKNIAYRRIKKKKKDIYYTIIKRKPLNSTLSYSKKPPLADKVTKLAKQKLGRRYVWGATGSNAFDCSGLTTYVYKKVGVNLPRTSRNQARFGKYVPKHKLRKGDLVFFDTDLRRRGIDHVGIYLGNGKFIHASSAKKKVIITSLNKPFYAKRFRGGRRVLKSSI